MVVYLLIATLLFVFYRPPKTINHGNRSFLTRLLDFDKVGTLLFIAGIFGTLLPLVWGGISYSWTHVAVILPLVVGLVVLLIVLPIHQYRKKEGAFFNHVLFRNRNMAVRWLASVALIIQLALVGIFTEGGAYSALSGTVALADRKQSSSTRTLGPKSSTSAGPRRRSLAPATTSHSLVECATLPCAVGR